MRRSMKSPILCLLAFALLLPARADAWFGWLDNLSGPGPFWGAEFDIPIACFLDQPTFTDVQTSAGAALNAVESYTALNDPERRQEDVTSLLATQRSLMVHLYSPLLKRSEGLQFREGLLALAKEADAIRKSALKRAGGASLEKRAFLLTFAQQAAALADTARGASVPRASLPRGFLLWERCNDAQVGEPFTKGVRFADRHPSATILLNVRSLTNRSLDSLLTLPHDFVKGSLSDYNKNFANGEPISLHIVEGKVAWPLSGHFDFLDAQSGIGVYWFRSKGFRDGVEHHGLVVEPVKVDLHAPARLFDSSPKWLRRIALAVSISGGVQLFPKGFDANEFDATGEAAREISGGEALLQLGLTINVGRLIAN